MGQAQPTPTRYTVEEYFALEEQSEECHEFFEGDVVAKAGGSGVHNDLVQNFVLALRPKLRGSSCRVKVETMQLAVRDQRHYTYPDVMVSCHPDDRRAERLYRHPVLIVEVLSRSTEAYDRGEKFSSYQQLPYLRHYLLVSQQQWLVEWFQKNQHGGWDYAALSKPDDTLHIPELALSLTLAEIYEETGVSLMRVEPEADN